jgi:GNAT superfamily N-acetyltransferase
MFTTEYGVASLVLKEIPYRQEAYICILATEQPKELLDECISFCRACGAERIDASGHECLEKYPLVTEMWLMICPREQIGETDACLFPMTEQTVARWLEIYNQRMADVPNAAYLDGKDGREFLENGDCYFVHKDGKLLGIGKAAEDYIDIVIAAEPGMGQTVMQALNRALSGETIRVVVAGENTRAVRLYQRMGFVKTKIMSKWHQIF